MSTAETVPHPWKERSAAIAFAGLTALACIAPFETLEPVGTLAGMQITNVEIALGVSILLGCLYVAFNGFHSTFRIALAKPVVLLIAVMLVSTLAASAQRGEAIRYVGRFTAGFCVCVLAANLLTTRRRFLGLTMAVVTVGSIVAALGVFEYFGSGLVAAWLDVFKPGPFYAGGLVRASSTLQYPTIASMFLEIAFGFGLGLLVHSLHPTPRLRAFFPFLSLLLIATAIMTTLTRGGLITLAAQLALVLTLYWIRRGMDRGLWVLLSLALLIGTLVSGLLYLSPTYRVRLQTENPRGWYQAKFEVPSQLEFAPGEIREVQVSITNLGEVTWKPDGPHPFYASYHWMDEEEDRAVVFEGHRSALPTTVPPGTELGMKVRVQAPKQPGAYRLAWDMVQEDRLWFSSETGISAYSRALVRGTEPQRRSALEGSPLPKSESRYQLDRITLWRGVFLILLDRPLLGVGPGNFRLFYGDYLDLETWNRSLHANNTFLEFFAGTGLPGGLLYLWLWFELGTLLIRSAKRTVSPPISHLVAAAAAVIAVFVHGMVDDFFSFTPTYVMIWMSFGVTAALAGSEAKDPEPGEKPSP